jgi:hypothetical protein
MLDQLSILLTHLLRHLKNTFLLTHDRLHEVATNKFHEAFELLDNCISTLCKFKCGTDAILSFPLLQADEAMAKKTRLYKAQDLTPLGWVASPLTPSAHAPVNMAM